MTTYRSTSGPHDPTVRGAMLADTNTIPWVELAEGVKFQLLRYCDVTGDWVLYVQLQPGVRFTRHQHITPAEFFITKGVLEFEGGAASAGVYGYEQIGEIHEEAGGDVVTEFLYIGHGPVSYIDADDNLLFIADGEFFKQAWEGRVPRNVVQ